MRRAELAALVGVTAAATCAVVFEAPEALRIPAGLALAFVLPGLAYLRALAPAITDVAATLMLTVAVSLAVDALTGVALQYATDLDAQSWGLALGLMTVAGFGVAGIRADRALASDRRHLLLRRPSRSAVYLLLAVGLFLGVATTAVAVSRRPSPPPDSARGYTLLSLLPKRDSELLVELRSGEFASATYDVEARVDGRPVQRWGRIRLAPNDVWSTTLRYPDAQRVDVVAYLSNSPATPYRHVHVDLTDRAD